MAGGKSTAVGDRRTISEREIISSAITTSARHNVIVDPDTLKINAIIDWEFRGFWPEWCEHAFWERPGPSVIEGEDDDTEGCREWLLQQCEEVVMPPL